MHRLDHRPITPNLYQSKAEVRTMANLRARVRSGIMASVFITLISCLCISGLAQKPGIGGPRDVDVATVNLYVGADVSPLAALDPTDPNFSAKLIATIATIHAQI